MGVVGAVRSVILRGREVARDGEIAAQPGTGSAVAPLAQILNSTKE
jgi:hypothetical protein